MAKNRVFHHRIVVEVKGLTSNDFLPNFIDKVFNGILTQLHREYRQLKYSRYMSDDLRTGEKHDIERTRETR